MNDGRRENIKNQILDKKYGLSVVLADDQLMKQLNTVYRKKTGTTNVLSFPLSETEGEIFINMPLAKKEAKSAGIPAKQYMDYLLIHSLLHLKGRQHGKKMEQEEDKIMEKIYGKKYYNRN